MASILLQAKGHDYSVEALLGGASAWAQRFAGGSFATLYLAPLQLSPHPHAGGRRPARRVVRPRQALQRQRGDRGGRTGTVRAQRAGDLRIRGGLARLCAGAGRRALRRQHRNRLARRCDAVQPAPRDGAADRHRPRAATARAGSGAGAIQHGVHGHPAVAAGSGGVAAGAQPGSPVRVGETIARLGAP